MDWAQWSTACVAEDLLNSKPVVVVVVTVNNSTAMAVVVVNDSTKHK